MKRPFLILLYIGFAAHAVSAWDWYQFDLPSGGAEATWRDALATELGGRTEVRVDGGRIDVLTDTYAIEVEWQHKWHEGLGQALHYADQTGKQGMLALVSYAQGLDRLHERSRERFDMVEKLCAKNGVKVVVLFPAQAEVEKEEGTGTRAPSETRGRYWLNTRTGVRHRPGCRFYESTGDGYHCGPEEGKPCSLCGG